MESKQSVEIPLEYLVSIHKMLNQSFEKMREMLGESVALMFFAMASEYDPLKGEGSADLEVVGGKLSSMLGKFGYSLQQRADGKKVEYRLYCPHAAKVHPQLGDGAIFCPMSQLVLGAVRKRHGRSVLAQSGLDGDGSSFLIEVQD